jgi:hypothetical protein
MEHSPVDLINGTDFIISKTTKGGYSDYSTSKWARKESSITEEMQDAIAQYGLPDLSTYLPKKPTAEQLGAMFEMFQASVDGELYDPERWQQFYRPAGFTSTTGRNEDHEAKAGSTESLQAIDESLSEPSPANISRISCTSPCTSIGWSLDRSSSNVAVDGSMREIFRAFAPAVMKSAGVKRSKDIVNPFT